ncbi:Uma2 family endonuclease [Methylovirgula sp. 4M-Z18]|nr:Uma2 family endonuclease [Methylovirgula sp. 4M-Z18]
MGALPKPMTIDEFLAWEERQELRHEYDGIQTYAMTGGTLAHAAIQINLTSALSRHLEGKPFRPFGSELKIRTQAGIRYPDAFVTCTEGDLNATIAPDPVVIFEILSKSTAWQDLGVKTIEYRDMPSVRRYVVLQQTHRAAEVFYRTEEGEWVGEFAGADSVLAMPEIGIALPLSEFYRGLALP